MQDFSQLAAKIIEAQEDILGPIALDLAMNVDGLRIDGATRNVSIEGNGTDVVEHLVEQYQHLFDKASVELCKEAVRSMLVHIPKDAIPPLLRS